MELVVVLHNIRSTYNVGAILRTMEGLGIKEAIFSGYTPRVRDVKLLPHLRQKLDKEIHKTALGAEELVNIYACDDIFNELKLKREQGWRVVGLENNIQDERLVKINDAGLKEKLGEKVVLVLGEEVNGIDHGLYDMIDIFLEIPMKGKKESFNVSVAAAIALAFIALS